MLYMELAIPLIALGGLYISMNQPKNPVAYEEGMSRLPNVDIQDENYPNQYNEENPRTAQLSIDNRYDGAGTYTDKYFKPQTVANNPDVKYTSLSGEQVGGDYFSHNNMVPFFGGNIRARSVAANTYESVLDNYTGSGSQILSKQERAPLFTPSEHQQWAHGAPNSTDFMRSRVNPSMRMANVKPFDEQKVGPGIGLGYTNEGSGGFNSGMMNRDAWSEKNVDDMRVATKPKASGNMILGYEGPAISSIKTMGSQGIQEKNRVERSFEMSSDRYMTTTGLEKAPTMRSILIDKDVSRPDTAVSYAGGAGVSQSSVYVDGEYMPSQHIDLGALPLVGASAMGKGLATEADYGIKAKTAYPNNRTENKRDDYFGAIGGAFGAAVAPLLDALRPSRKQNTVGTLRPYQNARAPVAGTYAFDANDVAPPTIRQSTEESNNHWNVNAISRGYSDKGGHQAANTARATTGNKAYVGASGSTSAKGTRNTTAERNQRNNSVKSATINSRMGNGNTQVFNPSINQSAKNKNHLNERALTPKGVAQAPSASLLGRVSGAQPLYQTIQADRNSPDILTAMQGNPYAIAYRAK